MMGPWPYWEKNLESINAMFTIVTHATSQPLAPSIIDIKVSNSFFVWQVLGFIIIFYVGSGRYGT